MYTAQHDKDTMAVAYIIFIALTVWWAACLQLPILVNISEWIVVHVPQTKPHRKSGKLSVMVNRKFNFVWFGW